jgi:glycine/D-amino acid oxidase-like deaminating enzyme
VTSLLRILIRNYRLQLHTNTPVTSIISPAGGTGHYTIHTSRGIVKARHVINATNAWISHLYPEFEKKIIPTRGQVVQVDGKHLKLNPMGFNDGGEYLVQRPDNSIIFGGGRRFASTSNALLF